MSLRLAARLAPWFVAALVASVLLGTPAQAYDAGDYDESRRAELQAVEPLESTKNENYVAGSASELGTASAEAKATGKPVEVEALRTEHETVYANPDGTFTQETSQSPIRLKDAEGNLVPVDASLKESEGRLAPTSVAEDVSFTATGEGALADMDLGEGRSISLVLPELTLDKPEVEGGVATYTVAPEEAPEPAPSTPPAVPPSTPPTDGAELEPPVDESSPAPAPAVEPVASSPAHAVRVGAGADGFAAHVVLEEAPAQAPVYTFDFTTPGLSATLEEGVVSFVDDAGVLVAQSVPMRMWDAQVDEAGFPTNAAEVDAELTQIDGGWRLELRPSMEFLAAESTVYPVVVDPDISSVPRLGDTHFADGADANTVFSNHPFIHVGYTAGKRHRGFMSFAYNQYLGATVTSANLRLWQFYAPSCTAAPTNVYSITGGDGPNRSWNTQPAFSTDPRWTASFSAQKGAAGCAAGAHDIDVTPIVNGWAGSHVGPHAKPFALRDVFNNRMAFTLTAQNETDPAQFKLFCSDNWTATNTVCSSADRQPTLSVTFTAEVGLQGSYSMTERQLGDRTTLAVNNKNGNVVVQNADLSVAGIGMDFALQRTYNSQGTESGPLGPRWSLSVGPDVWLEKMSEYRYDFHAPGGTVLGSFVRKSANPADPAYHEFTTPLGGAGADLTESGGEFTLTFRKDQSKYVFGQPNNDGDVFMRYLRDRSDNQMEIVYSGTAGSKPKVSQFIDTAGRTYTPTYTGNVITKISTANVSGVGVREVAYGYTSGNMTQFTDAMGAVTTYEYVAASGADLLSKIVQPVGDAGSAPTTEIAYNSGSTEVATVGYRLDNSATGLLTYSWQFNSGLVPACQDNGELSTVVTDARGKPTTYCYAERDNSASDAKIWVYDALGHARSQSYSADKQPLTFTSASNQSATADGSTVATYDNDITDQLQSVTQPKNSSSSGQATSGTLTYDNPTTVQGGTYLPTSSTDTAGDCNAYGYDSKGRTTVSYPGLTPTASGSCAPGAGAESFHSDYHPNGTLAKSWDANAGDSPTDDDKTIYTYWQPGEAGFVPGTQWQLKSIRKPGGNCAAGAGRRLCTSFTYDGAGRVLTSTDGRGIITRYAYDKNDRTTRVFYNNSNQLTCNLLGQFHSCVSYSYDQLGNLMQRSGKEGTTHFVYDRLNRQVQIDTPAEGLAVDRVRMGYDAVNNLISYHQTLSGTDLDVTNYGYDDANRPNVVHNAFGVTNVASDDDGRTSAITFPAQAGHPGTRVNYAYTNAGQPETMTWRTRDDVTELAKWDYRYTKTVAGITVDTTQQQARTVSSAYTSVVTPGTRTYGYDEQRLTSATDTAGPDYTYTYDGVGNIVSEQVDATTTHYGYNRAGELCWEGATAGTAAQKLSRNCVAGPAGSTPYAADAAGNNLGTAGDAITYNNASQVATLDDKEHAYLDQGNDLRTKAGSARFINGPLGITAIKDSGQTIFISRLPDGTPLTYRPSSGTQAYFITEPNGNVSYLVDPFGYAVGAYQYSPYGKTTVGAGISAANPLRWMGEYQETNADLTPGHYKLGARFYNTNGHFTQPDALAGNMGDPRTMTAYNYAGGDPINFSDASGLSICSTNTGYWIPEGCGNSAPQNKDDDYVPNGYNYGGRFTGGSGCYTSLVSLAFTAGGIATTTFMGPVGVGIAYGSSVVGTYSARDSCFE